MVSNLFGGTTPPGQSGSHSTRTGTLVGSSNAGTSSATAGFTETISSGSSSILSDSSASSSESSSTFTQSVAVTITSIQLVSGTATTNTSRGSAVLYVVFHNTGPVTSIISIRLTSPNLPNTLIYQCSGPSSCAPVSNPSIGANSDTLFNTVATGFYVGTSLTSGEPLDCIVHLGNGQTLYQSVTAS